MNFSFNFHVMKIGCSQMIIQVVFWHNHDQNQKIYHFAQNQYSNFCKSKVQQTTDQQIRQLLHYKLLN